MDEDFSVNRGEKLGTNVKEEARIGRKRIERGRMVSFYSQKPKAKVLQSFG